MLCLLVLCPWFSFGYINSFYIFLKIKKEHGLGCVVLSLGELAWGKRIWSKYMLQKLKNSNNKIKKKSWSFWQDYYMPSTLRNSWVQQVGSLVFICSPYIWRRCTHVSNENDPIKEQETSQIILISIRIIILLLKSQ